MKKTLINGVITKAKTFNKRVISLLVAICLMLAALPISIYEFKASATESTIVASDNFDSGLDSNWEWVTNNATSFPTPVAANGAINILSDTSRINQRLLRPASEARINQIASIEFDIDGMNANNRPIIFARVQDGSAYSGYSAFIHPTSSQGSIFLQPVVNGSVVTTYEYKTNLKLTDYAGEKLRLELKVEGTAPTLLTLSLYEVVDSNATLLSKSGVYEDSTAALQKKGRLGIGSAGNVNVDNFVYATTDAESPSKTNINLTDNFNSLDSKWEWISNNTTLYSIPTVSSGALVIKSDTSRTNQRLLRPASESAINQTASIEFDINGMNANNRPIIFVRVQDGSAYSGYSAFIHPTSSQGSIFLQSVVNGSVVATYEYKTNLKLTDYAGKTLRLELKAEGTEPTLLTLSLYEVATDGAATLLSQSSAYEDYAAALQKNGRVGIGSAGTVTVDNFVYATNDYSVEEAKVELTEGFDSTLESKWEWISNNTTLYPTPTVSNSTLIIISDNSRTNQRLLRPALEARVNQIASIDFDIDGMDASNRPIIFVRVQDGSAYSGYSAFIHPTSSQGSIFLQSVVNGAVAATYEYKTNLKLTDYAGKTLRLELKAEGTAPTFLTLSLYEVATDGIATLLSQSSAYEDNTAALQKKGRVGIGSAGTVTIDQFAYIGENPVADDDKDDEDEEGDQGSGNTPIGPNEGTAPSKDIYGDIYVDEFDRNVLNTEGQNWFTACKGSIVLNTKLEDGEIKFANGNRVQTRLVRPMSEMRVNQTVSIDFVSTKGSDNNSTSRVALLTRIQDTNDGVYNGYMAFYNVSGINIYKFSETETAEYGTLIKNFAFNNDIINKIEGKRVRLEFSAYGTNPTLLSTRLYTVDGETLTEIFSSETLSDNDAMLQKMGRAGFSIDNRLTVTRFSYSCPENNPDKYYEPEYPDGAAPDKDTYGDVFSDDFNRTRLNQNGTNWRPAGTDITNLDGTITPTIPSTFLDGETISITNNNRATARLVRPLSESRINQQISVDFKAKYTATEETDDEGKNVTKVDNKQTSRISLLTRIQDAENGNLLGYSAFFTMSSVIVYRFTDTEDVKYQIKVDENGKPVLDKNGKETKELKLSYGEPIKTFKLDSDFATKYNGKNLRFEFSAYGTNPTVLSVRLYEILADGTVSIVYDGESVTDDTAKFQGMGRVGIALDNALPINGFVYTCPEKNPDKYYEEPIPDQDPPTSDVYGTVFKDEFNRKRLNQNGTNWKIIGTDGSKMAATLDGNTIFLTGGNRKTAALIRPIVESRVNQMVSVDFNIDTSNLNKRPILYTRLQENADSKICGYVAFPNFSANLLYIYKLSGNEGDDEWGTLVKKYNLGSGYFEYYKSNTLRLEFITFGTNPTTMALRMYTVENGEAELIYSSKAITDNDVTYQKMGRAGFFTDGGLQLDNFIYTCPKTNPVPVQTVTNGCGTIFEDNFNRPVIGGKDWECGTEAKIQDNKLITPHNDYFNQRVIRPIDEAVLNQTVSIEFSNATVKNYPTVFLRMNPVNAKFKYTGYQIQIIPQNLNVQMRIYTSATEGSGWSTYAKPEQTFDKLPLETVYEDFWVGKTFRLECTAFGSNPTEITVKLFDITDGKNERIYTSTITDNTAELQQAGTVAIMGVTQDKENPIHIDNFIYLSPAVSQRDIIIDDTSDAIFDDGEWYPARTKKPVSNTPEIKDEPKKDIVTEEKSLLKKYFVPIVVVDVVVILLIVALVILLKKKKKNT